LPLFDPPPPRRGDILTAERLGKLEAEVSRLSGIRGGAGLAVRHSAGGLQITGQAQSTKYIGVATSDFAPRSGSTIHSGSVDLYWNNAGSLETTGLSIAEVWCVSSTTMTSGNSIDSGQYCTVWQDAFSTWWASPEECS
jgi:hypothetical protein